MALPIDRRQRVHDVCSILWARGILAPLGSGLMVRGAEQVSRDEPYIFVANPQSLLDATVMVAALQPLTRVRMVPRRCPGARPYFSTLKEKPCWKKSGRRE